MPAILATPADWPRITLAAAGQYDPDEGLAAAERVGAWAAWRQAVGSSPDGLVALVARAGLRGLGGAGYPTADKWRSARSQEDPERVVIANGIEADPGAFVDRTLMELDPHAVIEGTALAAYAVGARRACVAVNAAYGLAVNRLRAAVAAAEDAGYLGPRAAERGLDLQVEVRPLQGAFVLGEETVLIHALQSDRGMPDQRPPFPSVRGLDGHPTVVNNVETLAAVPWIVRQGAEAFAAAGRNGLPGTKLVQVSGNARLTGVAEVPMGTPLREILDQVAGGMSDGSTFKALLVGGPPGGFLPESRLDTPLDPDALQAAGGILGSGLILVVDQRACMVELGRVMERFMSDESCGKCIPCRIGTRRLFELTDRATSGRARPTDPQLLLDLAADVRDGSLCGHGILAPNPLISGMRYFRDEFDAHFNAGTCPAGVCNPLRVTPVAAAPR
ncbi:MAG TPA: NADH-ubiquinone oxidoreductase-F iron-sulfur binding region domain-containing protein [Candidatus Acidoferrales bacterium]|nr:NADH-ubiquinone oxidoreductase-F iron-sulfur binding region domain-containing protein [Candidatus Acidoferrales bacterium]